MQFRASRSDELPVAGRVFMTSLGEALSDPSMGAWLGYLEQSANVGAFVDDRLVGTATDFAAELTVPGGAVVTVRAVTGVGVLPTHRRQGAARGLMHHQIEAAPGAGAVALVLEASEGSIYGHFGYGPATSHRNVALRSAGFRTREPLDDDGRFEYAEGEAISHYAQPLYEQWRRDRPGQLGRPAQLWALTLVDVPEWRGGASELYWVFHVDAQGTPDGYVAYRIVNRWDASLPASEAKVVEVVAPDPHVRMLLLQFVAGLDLVEFVVIDGLPVDDPLDHLLHDPRQLRTAELRDGLWVRLVDVPGALSARRWWADDTLVLDVADDVLPGVHGRWRLAVEGGRAAVERTDAEPDLALGVAELGMLWLGGVPAVSLAGAGRIVGRPDAVARASRLFAGLVAPNHVGEF